jgi:hypothetical protein
MAAEMATGAPKPASDSSNAPKQNAIRMARMRWSSEMARIFSPRMPNQPLTTDSL